MEERELLDKIKADPAMFSVIFNLYYKAIFGYILRRTGKADDTADLAADTFLKAFVHIKQFTYKGISIKVWLYRIATNEVNLYFRYHRKRQAVFENTDRSEIEKIKEFMMEDKMELEAEMKHHQDFIKVLEQVKKLKSKYQDVIALRYFEGKENKEIAEILDLKEGTVKSLVSRGLEMLRQKCIHIDLK